MCRPRSRRTQAPDCSQSARPPGSHHSRWLPGLAAVTYRHWTQPLLGAGAEGGDQTRRVWGRLVPSLWLEGSGLVSGQEAKKPWCRQILSRGPCYTSFTLGKCSDLCDRGFTSGDSSRVTSCDAPSGLGDNVTHPSALSNASSGLQ